MISRAPKTVPKFLFLRNVFKEDCINLNTPFEKNIQSEVTTMAPMGYDPTISTNLLDGTSYSRSSDYKKNPKTFESLDSWPKSTNLHCWYCFNQFTGPPKFIPLVIEPNVHSKTGKKYNIGVEGNCCRWSCCKSYIKETTRDATQYIEKCNNLYFLYALWYGKRPRHIPEAPNKYLQKSFGGELTTEQYYQLYSKLEEQSIVL